MSSLNGIGVGIPYATYEGTGSITDSSTFYAPLETSLILQRGTGDPTWSRATKAWGFNELGYLEELDSGCAFFGGARLVRNLVKSNSENVVFTAAGSTPPTVTNGVTYLDQICSQIDIPITAGGYSVTRAVANSSNADMVLGRSYSAQYSVALSRPLVGSETIFLYFLTASKGVSQAVINSSSPNLSAFTTILGVTGDTPTATVGAVCNVQTVSAFASAVTIYITKLQVVEVTGYDASYVPEYVSVGVEASPYFGAGIDGAKYFNTGWNGAPLTLQGFRREAAATNNLLRNRLFHPTPDDTTTGERWVCAQTVGSELISNGDFSSDTVWTKGTGWSIAAGVATAAAALHYQLYQNLGAAITPGKTYTLVYTQTRTGGTLTPSLGSAAYNCAPGRNSSGTFTATFVCGAETRLYFYPNPAFSGTVDNVSLKECGIQIGTATGIDGIANTATTLTAFAADAIILQPITLASAVRCASAYVKRRTGTGTISFTQDGGSTWTDITSQINSSTWSRIQITSTLANPSVGFKISTSGDAIDVDCVQNEAGAIATSPIVTTTATVTRNAESLSYQVAGNVDFSVGTLTHTHYLVSNIQATRFLIRLGATGHSYITSADTPDEWRTYDGTNVGIKSGLSSAYLSHQKRAISWGGAGQKLTGSGVSTSTYTFDGVFGDGTTIDVGLNFNGHMRDVAIYNYQMTDAQLQAITS